MIQAQLKPRGAFFLFGGGIVSVRSEKLASGQIWGVAGLKACPACPPVFLLLPDESCGGVRQERGLIAALVLRKDIWAT